VRLQNQLEALLEEAHIKLSSLVSDLLGASARRMLHALAEGESDPAAVLGDQRLRATPAQLRDALGACTELNPVYRRLVQLIEQQIGKLDQEMASLLRQHQDAVQRLAEVPGLGSIRRNRSLPKWVPRRRLSPPPRISSPGLEPVREKMRPPA
jgi:transposase